ncbi:aromatase/cyclase [Streptomyces olivaceiscleroticus]|uniref:SRPBCC family protein n=1 Tax=Streptomyces olivaceiscleroticus TaxID=68245 RepID=A0ABN1BCF3_9ACTN
MSTAAVHRTVHETEIAAPADTVYAIVADAAAWPRRFAPTVHVDRKPLGEGRERLSLWATGAGLVRTWTSVRMLDPEARRITFRREVSPPPVKDMTGIWTVTPLIDGQVRLTLTHDFEAVDDSPDAVDWITSATNENSTTELDNIKRIAEQAADLAELEFDFEDTLFVRGSTAEVYTFLAEAERWPERLPHVARMDLREETDGVQIMGMHTLAKDGSTHLTESVRVCFPQQRIVYKQTVTPPLIAAHTGEWSLEPGDNGVLVRSRHSVVLNRETLGSHPAAGTTPAEVRAFVRESIGGNSRATLRHAARFAEDH